MNPIMRVLKNSVALSVSAIVERGAAIFIPWYIARARGSQALGYYSTALTFLTISASFAQWGLGQLLPREVARHPYKSRNFATHACAIGAVGSMLAMAVIVVTVTQLRYAKRLQGLILTGLAFSLLPRTEMVILESVINGLERMEWVAVARLFISVLRVAVVVYLLSLGYGLWVMFAASGTYHLLACALYATVILIKAPKSSMGISLKALKDLAVRAIPFVAMLSIGEAFKRFDRVFLSVTNDLEAVGVYSAAAMLLDISYLIARSLMNAIMPPLSRLYITSPKRFAYLLERLAGWLVAIVFPASLGLIASSTWLMPKAFGAGFVESSAVLGVSALGIAPSFVARMLFRSMLASDNERLAVRASVIKSVSNLALNAVLITRYGIIGAGVAHACIELIGFAQNAIWMHRQVPHIHIGRILLANVSCMVIGGGTYWLLGDTDRLAALLISVSVFWGTAFTLRTISLADLRSVITKLEQRERIPK